MKFLSGLTVLFSQCLWGLILYITDANFMLKTFTMFLLLPSPSLSLLFLRNSLETPSSRPTAMRGS